MLHYASIKHNHQHTIMWSFSWGNTRNKIWDWDALL